MLWFKRAICGCVALACIILGFKLVNNAMQLWQTIGFCILVGGIALAYIAIRQQMPNYNFWVTLAAIGLAYALYATKYEISEEDKQEKAVLLEEKIKEDKELMGQKAAQIKPEKKKKKKSTGFNLSAYPHISGSVSVIHAHLFYIGGRYVRLYGVDAPDNDQICSDATGRSYNCGEEAVSWIRGWIDNNQIDCYLLKVDPKEQDLATCVWGEYDIGAALVGAGWAIANTRETDIYRPYEAKAKAESSGLWQGTFYAPEDWRDIKRHKNDFTIKRRSSSKSSSFFDFGSLF